MQTKRFFWYLASVTVVLATWCGADAGPLDTPGAPQVLACSACHGLGGNSPGNTVPILAGMAPEYFKKAIQEYAEGKRQSPEMEPYAKMVLHFGVEDAARYFASQTPKSTPIKGDPAAVSRGKAAAPLCAACHGENGEGDPDKLIPSLRGQPPGYLKSQMLLFKEQKRNISDQSVTIMKTFMKLISDRTIDDLAAYYSSLR
ncbi:MAG: c-type cytochrome [Deltaproteobacteria bacterium]|nr:c-type cytochrome [Deltaproteobacteria bacterium]